ncbi:hypothetical protein CXF71_18920 [Colwellia sp. 12G3]|nr:hypothetical protein CXF71_18920 [Colwellia sp. 12G3]
MINQFGALLLNGPVKYGRFIFMLNEQYDFMPQLTLFVVVGDIVEGINRIFTVVKRATSINVGLTLSTILGSI